MGEGATENDRERDMKDGELDHEREIMRNSGTESERERATGQRLASGSAEGFDSDAISGLL